MHKAFEQLQHLANIGCGCPQIGSAWAGARPISTGLGPIPRELGNFDKSWRESGNKLAYIRKICTAHVQERQM